MSTHDQTDKNQNRQEERFEDNINENDSSSYSLGYKYLKSGIQSRSVGNYAGAISLFQNAVEAFKAHLVDHRDDTTAQDKLADALYQLADTFSLMPTVDLQQSQPLYQQALNLYAKLSGQPAKLRWAQCLARLGVLMIEKHSTHLPEQVQQLFKQNIHGDWNDEEAMEQILNRIDVDIPNQAIGYFQDAANVFRSNIDAEESRVMLATSLQNMAVALTHVGRLNDAIDALEESIGIYESIVEKGFQDDTAQGIAEAFYSLADLYLQNGSYEMSKDRYRRSMDCYENFQLPPLPTANDGLESFDWSDQIAEFENALEEYINLDADDMSMYGEEAEFFVGGDEYGIQNPGYEGDLHTNLGSLYLAQGDIVLAASHLQQAVRKYERLGEAYTHNMGTAKFNLAMLYFKSSEFSKSAVLHAEALDVFRLIGTEFPPIHLEDIEDQLQEVIQSHVKHFEDENDESSINEESDQEKSTDSDLNSKESMASIGKDKVSGLIVDVEHFLHKKSNISLSDEL